MVKLVSLLSFLLLFSCDSPMKKAMDTKPAASSKPKSGEWIGRRSDGSIRTRINYKNGLKHGISYLFYEDGKSIHLELPYVAGARHGISKKYFRNGALYAETSYEADQLHGIRSTYYENGKPKSRISYFHGLPGLDLEEFLKDGKKKEKPSINFSREKSTLIVTLDEKACREPRLFFGELVNEGYFDESDSDLEEIHRENGQFIIDLDTYTPSFLSFQDLICECKSSQGNPLIIITRIDVD